MVRYHGGRKKMRNGKVKIGTGRGKRKKQQYCRQSIMGDITEIEAEIGVSQAGSIICESEMDHGPLRCLIRWFNITTCHWRPNMYTAGVQFALSAL